MTGFSSPPQLLRALADNDFSGHDEQAIREQWIYPLLMLLGYGLGTPNTVDIPFKVELAAPVRALGSRRWEIDYRPTVHGVGLWIIEAKRPDEDLFSELHLGQAWGYATHPRVDVPLMVLANGVRVCVFDLTQEGWDEPVLEIAQSELPERFAEIEAVLGARQVADFVRRRQLRHLRQALAAQLDDEALEQTVEDVRAIVDEVRPEVLARRKTVTSDAWDEYFRREARRGQEIGVWGLAFSANGLNVITNGEIAQCVQMILKRPPSERPAAFDEMLSVARVGDTVRQTFSLRVLRLGVALRCVGCDGCDAVARETAENLVREAAEGLRTDPTAAAAHGFERVLAPLLARFVLVRNTEAAKAAVERARRTFDVERFLRASVLDGLSAEGMLSLTVALWFRQVWTRFEPWTPQALGAATEAASAALNEMPVPGDVRIGQINNANHETHLESDPLGPGTRNVVCEVADPKIIHSDDGPALESERAFAAQLLKTYFPDA
jgi:hypothetical protein